MTAPSDERPYPREDAEKALHELEYDIETEGSPNVKPGYRFLVRIRRPRSEKLDHRPIEKTMDIVGAGATLDEAVQKALKRYRWEKRKT